MPLSADERRRRYHADPTNRSRRLTVDAASRGVRQAKRRSAVLRGTLFERLLTIEELFIRLLVDRRE